MSSVASLLKRTPFMYKSYEEEPWKSKGLQIFSVDSYNIFYLPNKKSKSLIIVRVVYGGRDLPRVLC